MFPVLGLSEFVATIPVDVSPSGGQNRILDLRSPVGSNIRAPFAVSFPASEPARRTLGKISWRRQVTECSLISVLNA